MKTELVFSSFIVTLNPFAELMAGRALLSIFYFFEFRRRL